MGIDVTEAPGAEELSFEPSSFTPSRRLDHFGLQVALVAPFIERLTQLERAMLARDDPHIDALTPRLQNFFNYGSDPDSNKFI